MACGHVYVVLVARVQHFATHAAAVLKAVGKVHRLHMVQHVELGAVLEVGANGAEPCRWAIPVRPTHVLVESIQAGPFRQKLKN